MRTLLYLEIYARRVFTVDIADLHGTSVRRLLHCKLACYLPRSDHELRTVPANAPGGGYSKPALASVMTITFFLDAVWHVHCPSI
jgi:hypothetical protein